MVKRARKRKRKRKRGRPKIPKKIISPFTFIKLESKCFHNNNDD